MPQWKQHGSTTMTSPDEWGARALAIAAALDTAADELRNLINSLRPDEEPEGEDTKEGHEPDV